MNDEHIIEYLDSAPLSSLSGQQMETIRVHNLSCVDCDRAYRAAMISQVLIKERSQVVVEPSPFFQTKVLAALRERQATESIPALARLWKSAGALVSSMALTTAALAALSFMVPTQSPLTDATASAYSAESVLLDQGGSDQMSYDQVLSTIYADDDEAK